MSCKKVDLINLINPTPIVQGLESSSTTLIEYIIDNYITDPNKNLQVFWK